MIDGIPHPHARLASPPRTLVPRAAQAVQALLERLQHGALLVQWPDGSCRTYGPAASPTATMRVHGWQLCAAVLSRGDIGLAESYLEGHWQTPDLTALLRLFVANRNALEAAVYGRRWGLLLYRLRHALQRNSRRGSRRNIAAHYDLGNPFYQRWLDVTMNYSSAWFEHGHAMPLAEAQQAKMRRALRQAGVKRGSKVLEIGCGWGALAEVAARDFEADITGLTLSYEQWRHGRARIAAGGLDDRVDLRLQDYREMPPDRYDAVVSIEMFEAVGERYWPVYFRTVARTLRRGGRACIQTITLRDDLFARYARSTDFIQQYIFPGGMLPSLAAFREAAQAAGLTVEAVFHFGSDYAETLRRWHAAFVQEAESLEAMGFDRRFQRLWCYYLSYCEAAFSEGNTDVVQVTLSKP